MLVPFFDPAADPSGLVIGFALLGRLPPAGLLLRFPFGRWACALARTMPCAACARLCVGLIVDTPLPLHAPMYPMICANALCECQIGTGRQPRSDKTNSPSRGEQTTEEAWRKERDVRMAFRRSLYAKYGGVHFMQMAPVQDINKFVRELPDEKRDSLFEVLHELNEAGLIEIQNDHHLLDPMGEEHPSHPNAIDDLQ